MKPKKENEYYHHKKPEPIPEQPNVKVRSYTLIFADKPDIKHQIIISQKDKFFTYEIRFSKPLLHPITRTVTTTNSLSCSNLTELKELLKGYLKGFGKYTITPE
jgi:hypothetical protein